MSGIKDIFVGAAIAGSTFLGSPAQGQTSNSPSPSTEQSSKQDTIKVGDFDITEYADFMKKRGFEVQLDKCGAGTMAGTNALMLQVVCTRKVGGDNIEVTDYLMHRVGRDFDKNTSDPTKFGVGDLENRELTVRDDRRSIEYALNVDYDPKEKNYVGLSNVIGTGTRTLPAMTPSDATLLLSRIGANPESFIDAERTDIQLSKRDMDGGGRNAPKP